MATKQVRWNLFLPPELLEEAKAMAVKHEVTAADVVRTALEKYLAALKRLENTQNAAQ